MKQVGLIGLGVMGRSLAINMSNNGYNVSLYNRSEEITKELVTNSLYENKLFGYYDYESFVLSLEVPRVIFIMTKAGAPVDEVIENLLPYLDKDDLIIDGGNALYKDTDRRLTYLESKNINFLGIGISGGESGALNGPSIMPGGKIEVYKKVETLLSKIAAKSKYGSCSNYMGHKGAGHFVKMVHNAIEYAMMQSIAEVYHYLKEVDKYSNQEISNIFKRWNLDKLNSYLMEITIEILLKKDVETKNDLVDMILDTAQQKGTGVWTVEAALDLSVPTLTLNNAVINRNISAFKQIRSTLSKKIEIKSEKTLDKISLDKLENALIFTNYITFSQGLWLISEASKQYEYEIDLVNVLKTWTGGCIIRAKMLDDFILVLEKDQSNYMLINDKAVLKDLADKLDDVILVLENFNNALIPSSSINSTFQYFLSITKERLPMNLTQAQRDFFGAHTYQRIDKEGVFHTIWED